MLVQITESKPLRMRKLRRNGKPCRTRRLRDILVFFYFTRLSTAWKKIMTEIINPNPVIFSVKRHQQEDITDYDDEDSRETFTSEEIFDVIRDLNDPEHPLTLEQLNVLSAENIEVDDAHSRILVKFTPTIPHCSMATLIGLCIRVKLLRSLPSRFKVTIKISPGSHQTEDAINKQLNDKERVAAALENTHLLNIVNKCISKK
jgi:metal-sulfur cluster biosynthetic enzyme